VRSDRRAGVIAHTATAQTTRIEPPCKKTSRAASAALIIRPKKEAASWRPL